VLTLQLGANRSAELGNESLAEAHVKLCKEEIRALVVWAL